jgi:hypothetical protein
MSFTSTRCSFSIFEKFKNCHNINYVAFANVGNGTWNENPTQTHLYLWIGSKELSMGNLDGLDVMLLCSKTFQVAM